MAIGTKRVFRNKKDKRGIVIRNKARLEHRDIEKKADILKKFQHTLIANLLNKPIDYGKAIRSSLEMLMMFDVHLYRSMIRYLKGKPTLGLWYSRDSLFELVVYTDSDYVGATQDRKSTTGGCQFLGNRLISWQCKKQTMVATSTTKAEYVVAASCCRQSSGPLVKVGDEVVHKELGDRIKRAATNASSLEAEQDSVDKKNVIITETSIRSDLHLEDAGGTDCLPTATIFEELARMGYEKPSQKLTFYKAFFSPQWKFLIHTITQCLSAKSTTWNEFSSIMASLIICLATNQNFNLSKYIFDAMVKHLDGGVKFLMYP
ncbi:hypothetical protein Tco_0646197 [Tanacetum coccineum]